MNNIWQFIYNIILSLWIGGISIFTFIATPIIFRDFERDMAGRIVGKLFPAYFMYNLALSVLALLFLLVIGSVLTKFGFRLSMALVVFAVIVNMFVTFKLHPDVREVKQKIHSFEVPADDSHLRKQFGKLHAISASLNLLILADGVILLFLGTALKK